jgi:DNA invertase Pin-like site-specific DNA recombinase
MNGEQKITPEHLRRKAIIYLRQSSEGQVRNNLESQQLQYALAHRVQIDSSAGGISGHLSA